MNYSYEVTSSLLASLTGIYGLNILYELIPDLRHDLGSYRRRMMYIPLYFFGLTFLIDKFFDSILDNDAKIRYYMPYITGFIVGLILSIFGRYYWKLDEIIGINNPIMFHLYFSIFYMIFYGLIIGNLIKNLCN